MRHYLILHEIYPCNARSQMSFDIRINRIIIITIVINMEHVLHKVIGELIVSDFILRTLMIGVPNWSLSAVISDEKNCYSILVKSIIINYYIKL